jgi:hypothetical protein
MTLPGRSAPATLTLHTHVGFGADAVAGQVAALCDLAESIPGTPVTARWPWLSASVTRAPQHEQPWLLSITADDRLVAAAVLLDDTSGNILRTRLAGTAENHRGALLAFDDQVAAHLGTALGNALMAERREFSVGPVSHGPALDALLEALPIGLIVDEVSVPLVRTVGDLPLGISHGMARTLRKAANRMAADCVQAEVAVTADRSEITSMLPLLENISRDRDHAGGRPSPLDDPIRRQLWQRRVLALAGAGVLQMAMLQLNGDLAAYVLGIEDGDAYRILEGRYVGRWARYAPGRVLEAAVLDTVAESPTFQVLDWMTAVAPETLLAANAVDPLVVVQGRT